jgi:hypothetical protein
MNFRSIAFLAALLASGAAAADNHPAKPVVIKDVAGFLDHQRQLRDDLGTRKFRHLGASQRRELLDAQEKVFALLEGKRSIEQLSHEQQIELYNAQHVIASIVSDAELDRPICKREKRIGSNRSETVCTTKRSLAAQRSEVDRVLKGPRNCGGPDCLSTRE